MASSTENPAPATSTTDSDTQPKKSRALEVYENWATFPIFGATITWIVALMFEFDPRLSSIYRREGILLTAGVVIVFIIDLLIRFLLDSHKATFLKRNWILILAIILPPLRFVLILSAIRRIRRGVNSLTAQVGLYALYGVATVVFLGSVFTLAAEINRPDSNIESYGDAVWWAFATITTVGYGDYTPVTETGRTIAVIIMFSGAAAVGSFTAALASRFSVSKVAEHRAQAQATTSASGEGTAVVTEGELKERIEGLERRLEDIAAHLGVPVTTAATRPPGGE